MIIFGTRGVTSSAGQGDFFCPGCQAQAPYRHKRARRFFTLYFIPLIPLDQLGEYIECQQCRGTYQVEVLNYRPGAGTAEFEAEFHRAVKRVMVDMMLADGSIEDGEIAVIQGIYEQLTGRKLSEEAVQAEIRQAGEQGEETARSLTQIAGNLNDQGKEMVVRAAFMVAGADGQFQEEELAMITDIGQSLGMSAAHLKAVLSPMLEQ